VTHPVDRLSEGEKDFIARGLLRWADENRRDQEERKAEIDRLNAEIRADCSRRRAEWLPTFEEKVGKRQPITAEEVENYSGIDGAIPAGYRPRDSWSFIFVWSGGG